MYRLTHIFYLFIATPLFLAGCNSAPIEQPHEVYERYYKLIIAGRTFEQDKAFYSKSRQAEVLAKLQASGEINEELTVSYLKFTQQIAECGKLKLVKETIDGKRATLEYSRKDTCATPSDSEGSEIIEMVDEDGWKIESNLTKIN